MPPNIKVCINGFVLSTMLFDCCNNNTDQEGFLYGTVARNVRDEINDHSLSGTQEDILISVCSSVHVGTILSFYNDRGHINEDDIEANLQDRKMKVIGWYRYRRYSTLYPSARETVVHQKLKQYFDAVIPNVSKYFVYAVFSSSNLPNFATHSYDYAFFTQRQNQTFKNLSVTILNLGDTRNSYRTGSMALPFADSPSFNSVMFQYMNLQSFHKLEDNIQSFHLSLRSKLSSLQEELAASDAINAGLEKDIERLFNDLQSLLASQEQQSSSSHSTPASHSTNASHSTASTSTVSEACLLDKDSKSPPLKRTAIDTLVPDLSQKRACLDKYFDCESQDFQLPGFSETASTPKIPTANTKETPASHMMIVDPDNGEASVSQSANISRPSVSTSTGENVVSSPSSVDVVISDSGPEAKLGEKGSPIAEKLSREATVIKEIADNPELTCKKVTENVIECTKGKPSAEITEQSLASLKLDCSIPTEDVSNSCLRLLKNKSSFSNSADSSLHQPDKEIFPANASKDKLLSPDIGKKTNTPFIVYATKTNVKDATHQCPRDSFEKGDMEEK